MVATSAVFNLRDLRRTVFLKFMHTLYGRKVTKTSVIETKTYHSSAPTH